MFGIEALLKRPPHFAADVLPGISPIRRTAIGGASSAADFILNGGDAAVPPTGCYVTWIADTDCYLHMQSSTIAGFAATAASSMFLPAGVFVDWWHKPLFDDRVVVIQKTAGGFLYRWMSSP